MYIIGELINGMYRKVAAAVKERDTAFIRALARQQVHAGADALDVNCGPASRDAAGDMSWLVETVQKEVSVSLCLDSTKSEVIEACLKHARAGAIINSTTADEEKLKVYFPLAKKYKASLIALAVDKNGIPRDKERRLELAARILEQAAEHDFPVADLYLDPILMPINVAQKQLFDILETIKDFKGLACPAPKVVLGLSNISQGTEMRSLVNRTFLTMAQSYGLDAAILDPLDEALMHALIAGEVILNKAIYCDSFVDAYLKSKRKN